jgi:creatinine amidohydrolase
MTNFESVRYELQLPWMLREHLARRPVAYIPLGTYEWHCEHLPVGLDALTAHGLCLRAAREDGGIVMPALHYGTGGGHGHYPWTIIKPEPSEIEALLNFTLLRLEALDLRLAVIFSGHFADNQLEMVDGIASTWNAKANGLKVFATAVNRIKGLSLGPDHAGIFETTLLHALHPELVQIDRLPSLSAAPLSDGDVWEKGRHDPTHPIWGVVGPDPRLFNPQDSAALLAASVQWLVSEVRKRL